jgi:hypothetical protein
MQTLSAAETARALPYDGLAQRIASLLRKGGVNVPTRLVPEVSPGARLFVMPASDGQLAITKLITLVNANAERGLPVIQGQVVVFDAQDGRCLMCLDGPTVTARRTAAVSHRPTLAEVLAQPLAVSADQTVFFHNCGWGVGICQPRIAPLRPQWANAVPIN